MTVLVCRDGILASDTGSFEGAVKHRWTSKLQRAADGLYGTYGEASAGQAYRAWLRSDRTTPEPFPESMDGGFSFGVLRLRRDGSVGVIASLCGWEHYPDPPYYAVGAGPAMAVAYGALWQGATAREAVLAAIEHCTLAAGDVESIAFED